MPNRDGTGPYGTGPCTGRNPRGRGRCGGSSAGPSGYCVCPNCGYKTAHTAGVPCSSVKCPNCGTFMIRGS